MIGLPADDSDAWALGEEVRIGAPEIQSDPIGEAVATGKVDPTQMDEARRILETKQAVVQEKINAKPWPWSKIAIAGAVVLGGVALLARRRLTGGGSARASAGKKKTPTFRVKGSLKLR